MAIWFRNESCTVGVDDGVIRAADFARFTSLLSAAKSVATERDRMLADTHAEIAQMRSEAQITASHLIAEAEAERDRAFAQGFDRGMETAATDWAEKALKGAWSKHRELERQTERLSDIVSMAVDRVIEQSDRSDLHRRALRTVARLMKEAPLLVLRVPEAEADAARIAVEQVVPSLGGTMHVEVRADAALPPGSCIFESELGVIDASLETQLTGIRRAISRAAHLVALEAIASQQVTDLRDEDASLEASALQLEPEGSTDPLSPSRTLLPETIHAR